MLIDNYFRFSYICHRNRYLNSCTRHRILTYCQALLRNLFNNLLFCTKIIPLQLFSNKSFSNRQVGTFGIFFRRWWLATRISHICSNRTPNYEKQTAHPSWRNFPMTSHSRMKVLPFSTNTVASTWNVLQRYQTLAFLRNQSRYSWNSTNVCYLFYRLLFKQYQLISIHVYEIHFIQLLAKLFLSFAYMWLKWFMNNKKVTIYCNEWHDEWHCDICN